MTAFSFWQHSQRFTLSTEQCNTAAIWAFCLAINIIVLPTLLTSLCFRLKPNKFHKTKIQASFTISFCMSAFPFAERLRSSLFTQQLIQHHCLLRVYLTFSFLGLQKGTSAHVLNHEISGFVQTSHSSAHFYVLARIPLSLPANLYQSHQRTLKFVFSTEIAITTYVALFLSLL